MTGVTVETFFVVFHELAKVVDLGFFVVIVVLVVFAEGLVVFFVVFFVVDGFLVVVFLVVGFVVCFVVCFVDAFVVAFVVTFVVFRVVGLLDTMVVRFANDVEFSLGLNETVDSFVGVDVVSSSVVCSLVCFDSDTVVDS